MYVTLVQGPTVTKRLENQVTYVILRFMQMYFASQSNLFCSSYFHYGVINILHSFTLFLPCRLTVQTLYTYITILVNIYTIHGLCFGVFRCLLGVCTDPGKFTRFKPDLCSFMQTCTLNVTYSVVVLQAYFLRQRFQKPFSLSSSQSQYGLCGTAVWYLDQQVCIYTLYYLTHSYII